MSFFMDYTSFNCQTRAGKKRAVDQCETHGIAEACNNQPELSTLVRARPHHMTSALTSELH